MAMLSPLARDQWGMVTAAQAGTLGVTAIDLTRLGDRGLLFRLRRGVYQVAAAPPDRRDPLRAAWLGLVPAETGRDRLKPWSESGRRQPFPAFPVGDPAVHDHEDAVVSGRTAAWLHGATGISPLPLTFSVGHRRQSRHGDISLRIRPLPRTSVEVKDGLPVTTIEQTIADLLEAREPWRAVARVLAEFPHADSPQLAHLLVPLAQRYEAGRGNGVWLLNRLRFTAEAVRPRTRPQPTPGSWLL